MKFQTTLTVLLISFTSIAFAGSASCYSIKNKDKKNLCLAEAKQKKSYCYSIGDRDKKNLCLAVIGKQKSYCYIISSSEDKHACLGRF